MAEARQHDLPWIVEQLRGDIGNTVDPRPAEQARRIAATLRQKAATGDAAATRELEKYAPLPFEEAQAIVLSAWRTDPRRTALRLGETEESLGPARAERAPQPQRPPARQQSGGASKQNRQPTDSAGPQRDAGSGGRGAGRRPRSAQANAPARPPDRTQQQPGRGGRDGLPGHPGGRTGGRADDHARPAGGAERPQRRDEQ